MKKNLLKIISIVTLVSLSGCGGNNSSSVNSSSNSTNTSSSVSIPEGTIQYKVQVLLPDGSKANEGLQVQWCDDMNCFSANTDANGVASIYLVPKEYDVHIYNYSEIYACELGIKSDENNSSLEVKLHNVLNYKEGSGTKDNPYIVNEGVYNITLSDIDEENKVASEVFVGFVPNRPGKYVIESWTENTDTINTNVGYYGNNPQFIPENPIDEKYDDDSGDTDNFRLEFNIGMEEFVNTGEVDNEGNMIYEKDENGNYIAGGIYRFGIGATNIRREKTFPIVIKYLEHYESPKIISEEVEVSETLTKCNDVNEEKIWKDCLINGLDTVVYNENDRFYHLESNDGYILYAKISSPCSFIDVPFTEVEDAGSSALTLDNGTKNYTNFIDTYAEYCNSDGVYPVTNELKTFLELYYLANESWITSVSETVVDAEYGWLFAVGYYCDLADLYDKPWAGVGTIDEAYCINPGNFLVDVKENETVYYSFISKNSNVESLFRVKSSEENIEFVGLEDYNVTLKEESGVKYFDITLGGMMNSNLCLFGIKTKDNSASKLEFTLEAREKTVSPNNLSLGDNTIEIKKGDYVECTFIASNAGTYIISSNEENAWLFYGDKDFNGSEGEIKLTIECSKGDTISFGILTVNGEEDFITFNISRGSSLKVGLNEISVAKQETLEEEFVAPEDGTYKFMCLTDNGAIGYFSKYGAESFFGDTNENYFEKSLNAGDSFTVIIYSQDFSADTIRIMISKI